MERLSIKEIRKALHRNEIRLSIHVVKKMSQRGYTKKDLLCCIWMGEQTELQFHRGQYKSVIEGMDCDGLPMACIVGVDGETECLKVITVFPPIKDKFKRVI